MIKQVASNPEQKEKPALTYWFYSMVAEAGFDIYPNEQAHRGPRMIK